MERQRTRVPMRLHGRPKFRPLSAVRALKSVIACPHSTCLPRISHYRQPCLCAPAGRLPQKDNEVVVKTNGDCLRTSERCLAFERAESSQSSPRSSSQKGINEDERGIVFQEDTRCMTAASHAFGTLSWCLAVSFFPAIHWWSGDGAGGLIAGEGMELR
jgi:hypothetical protein